MPPAINVYFGRRRTEMAHCAHHTSAEIMQMFMSNEKCPSREKMGFTWFDNNPSRSRNSVQDRKDYFTSVRTGLGCGVCHYWLEDGVGAEDAGSRVFSLVSKLHWS
jgi:hypothetical protein